MEGMSGPYDLDAVKIQSPAKVNFWLEILHKRNDGYHEIRTIMQPIDLCDELVISLTKEKVCLASEGEMIPLGGENLAHRAAEIILDEFKIDIGVKIYIRKRIPPASGLGGGSSNAAATLIGLNRLLKLDMTKEQLIRMGVRLGADVPFFISGKPALATGIGHRLKEIELPSPIWMVLVNPGLKVSTAWAYKNFKTGLTKKRTNINIFRHMINISEVADSLYNDLESVTIKKYPEINEIKQGLIDNGSLGALMSGSGPTVFGIFPDKETAEKAFRQLGFSSPDHTLFLSSSFDNNNQGGLNGSNRSSGIPS